MKLYEGRLILRRTTNAMAVYGDEQLRAQYIPKTILKKSDGKSFPRELIFTITLPDSPGKKGSN
jgi:hypothetical protein